MSTGIYSYTNKTNGKMYIGQSKNLESRKNKHLSCAFNPNDPNFDAIIHQAFRKHGYENFEYNVLEECLVDELNDREIYWITYYDTFNNGYNLTPGGSYAVYQKLDNDKLNEITLLLKDSDIAQMQIAEDFGVHFQTISYINTGALHKRDIQYPIRNNRRKDEDLICPICGGQKTRYSKMCVVCQHRQQQRSERPEPLALAEEILQYGFEGVGRTYNVSGNAIKKWCKAYGIPHLKQELKDWYKKNK